MQDKAFISVARKIGDPRLAGVLADHAEHHIKMEVHNDNFYRREGYSLKAIRGRIQKLKKKAQQCEKALSHISSGVPLLYFPVREVHRLDALHKALHDVTATCENALALNHGKGRPPQPGKLTCALIIVEAWGSVRGKRPGHNNVEALALCDEYWRACGYENGGDWSHLIIATKKAQSNYLRRIRADIDCALGKE